MFLLVINLMDKVEKQDNYSQILKYTGLFGGVQGLSILVGVVRNKLVASLLGTEGMGLVALFNSTIKLLGDSTNLGLSMSSVREISDAYGNDQKERLEHAVQLIRSWSLFTAIMGMLVCLVFSPLLNRWVFSWGDHTLHFVFLSPVIALMAITGGELAILKGTRQLRHLAALSVYNVIAAFLIAVPLFYYWRESAIVPSIFFVSLAQMILTISYSYRLFHPTFSFNKTIFREGIGMVKLGIAFVLAGILGSGAEFLIRSYLNNAGSLDTVGLYNAGYMMTMVYAGMVFSAMETDFFPRLSGIKGTGPELNDVVNKQIEVCLLLISPMLVAFLVALPILLPLLYTGKFMPALGMMQITVLAMYMRAIKLPISYLPLAKGDSGVYLLMEGVYDVVVVVLVILAYQYYGLTGTGAALAIASVFDFLMLYVCMHYVYHYDLSVNILRYSMLQIPIGILAYLLTFFNYGWTYWTLGIVLSVISFFISIKILHSKTRLWATLKKKIKRKR